jgi:pimeloyl-ACP methyl ester carboxylesterase
MKRIWGAKDLLLDVVQQTTTLVAETHASASAKVFRPLEENAVTSRPTQVVRVIHDATARGVYTGVRAIAGGVAGLLGVGLAAYGASKPVEEEQSNPDAGTRAIRPHWVDHVQSGLNGFYGDYLHQRRNALALGMSLRQHGQIISVERGALERALPQGNGRFCIFIHGLGVNESSWSIAAERFYGDPAVNFGSQLQADLGLTPLYVRYNTGRHISENGRLLSLLLARLCAEDSADVEEITLIGHSMGGLVARSAAHYGALHGEPWVAHLRHVVCIGSPHLGAPLEKATNAFASLLAVWDAAGAQVPARILNTRSAGVKDLRFGYTVDEEWQGQDPDAFLLDNRQPATFVEGVNYAFIAATITKDAEHPLGVLLGDVLVRTPSAAGHAHDSTQRIPFHSGHFFGGINHLHLANHPDVYQALRATVA